jgi:hypothetical protein
MLRLALAALAIVTLATPPLAAAEDVPESTQGRWADQGESCDEGRGAVVVSATTLVYPDGRIDGVSFTSGEAGAGTLSLRDGVAAYSYDPQRDRLLFYPEGVAAQPQFPMVRCQETTRSAERRCGWLINLQRGDWSLIDADRTWILARHDDANADTMAVMDMVPAFDPAEFVATGEYYGYGCACLTVIIDGAQGRVTAIASSKRLPLAICRTDPALPAPVD